MPARILVVDDDPAVLELIESLLTTHGYVVLSASTPEEALEIAQADPEIDVILLDVVFGKDEMDGFEVCRRLRADPRTSRVGILMLTARHSISDIMTGLEAGADDYLAKICDPRELLARLKAHIRLRNLQRQLVQAERLATIGQMIITLSDKINNPLTVILWHAQNLLSEPQELSPELQTALADIEKSARQIEEVMSQLRELKQLPKVREFTPGQTMIEVP